MPSSEEISATIEELIADHAEGRTICLGMSRLELFS